MTTNVPRPTLGPAGFVAPDEDAILAGVQLDLNAVFGRTLNFGTTVGGVTNPTPQGQLATTQAAVIGDANAVFLWFTNQVDPALNSGRMQDAIARIYFIERIPSAPTVIQCSCGGLDGVTIPEGQLAQGSDGLLYGALQAGTIAGGTVSLPFACTSLGPVPAPFTLKPYQTLAGWDTIAPGAAVLGNNVESRAAFEERRRLSTAINSQGMLPSILGAVLAVPGVLDAFVTENNLSTAQTIGGVLLVPNSIYVAVVGGLSSAVAAAIWSRKAPGANYNGNTTVNVQDPSPQYVPPIPTYAVTYEVPPFVNFAVLATLKNANTVPADVRARVQAAIVSAFAGLDGGSRAKIGSIVFASRYYGGVLALGNWVELVSLQLGVSGAACAFTGAISGTTLTVSAIGSGSLAAGQLLQNALATILTGTTIVTQLTGSAGSTGTYQVSQAQSLVSGPLTATALLNSLALNINQAPAIAAANIHVALT